MEVEKYAKYPDRKAIVWLDDKGKRKEITYTNLMEDVNKIGSALLNSGLTRGDKILIMISRLIEAYEVYLAALKTGIIIVPTSEMLKTKDLQYRITQGEVSGIVSYYPFVDQYDEIQQYDDLIKFSVGKTVEE